MSAIEKSLRDEEAAQEELERLNTRFALVTVGTEHTDTVVAEFTEGHRRFVAYKHFDAFKRHLSNASFVPAHHNSAKSIPLAQRWLTEPDRARRYSRLVCAPPGSPERLDSDAFNTWEGLAVRPRAGDWSEIQVFLFDIICGGNAEHYDWLLNWMAALVQRPGERGHSAIILIGGQGIGKGTFAESILGGLFPPRHFAHLTSPELLTSNFNAHLKDCPLVFADEAVWASKALANRLKALITERTLWAEQKYLPRERVHNMMHLVIASNADAPVQMERDDRRYLVLRLSEERKGDSQYFAELRENLAGGGHAAMLHDLLNRVVDVDLLRHPPNSAAKAEMKAFSLEPADEWWRAVLTESTPERWRTRVSRPQLLEEHQQWARGTHTHGRAFASPEALGSYLSRHFHRAGMHGWPKLAKVKGYAGKASGRVNAWEFPSLPECREAFERATGVSIDP